MSAHPQTASATNADQRLSQLIKLKQLERPDAAYWQRFDQEFRSRQLTTFVQIQPVSTRLRRACMILARKAAPPVAAAGAVAITFFAVTSSPYLADSTEAELKPERIPFASTEKDETPPAYFVVNTEVAAPAQDEAPNRDTIYQVNALSSLGSKDEGYLLNATPVTYSRDSVGLTNGANVLRQQPNY